jgi:DNA polymerase
MENQRSAFAASWAGFLPEGAVVMARAGVARPIEESPAPFAKISPSNDSLQQIAAELTGCQRCKLCAGRKTIVFGEGNPHAELVFVGEGPGEQEDIQGRPFVGKAGQLLDKMIQAIGLTREQVYICNVVKCRPPGNRNPEPDEIAACNPFLERQLDQLQPKVVVALGKFAAQTLLQTEERISSLRGHFKPFRGTKLMPTWHPAYLLRNPDSKREAWADLLQVAAQLGLKVPGKPTGGS